MTLALTCGSALAWMVLPSLQPQSVRPAASFSRVRLCSGFFEDDGFEFAFDDDGDDDDNDEVVASGSQTEGGSSARAVRVVGSSGGSTMVNLTITPNVTVAHLQQQLKQLGQKHTGSKPQLIERLTLLQRKHAMGLPLNDMEVTAARFVRLLALTQPCAWTCAVFCCDERCVAFDRSRPKKKCSGTCCKLRTGSRAQWSARS